jgi:hypothetical protein
MKSYAVDEAIALFFEECPPVIEIGREKHGMNPSRLRDQGCCTTSLHGKIYQ